MSREHYGSMWPDYMIWTMKRFAFVSPFMGLHMIWVQILYGSMLTRLPVPHLDSKMVQYSKVCVCVCVILVYVLHGSMCCMDVHTLHRSMRSMGLCIISVYMLRGFMCCMGLYAIWVYILHGSTSGMGLCCEFNNSNMLDTVVLLSLLWFELSRKS